MRAISCLASVAVWLCAPAGAQSVLRLEDAEQGRGPNAEAAQRPAGPNAQVAQGTPPGPNTELMPTRQQAYYPSCAAAGAVRALPVRQGESGYGRHLDRDGDGVACEPGMRPPAGGGAD